MKGIISVIGLFLVLLSFAQKDYRVKNVYVGGGFSLETAVGKFSSTDFLKDDNGINNGGRGTSTNVSIGYRFNKVPLNASLHFSSGYHAIDEITVNNFYQFLNWNAQSVSIVLSEILHDSYSLHLGYRLEKGRYSFVPSVIVGLNNLYIPEYSIEEGNEFDGTLNEITYEPFSSNGVLVGVEAQMLAHITQRLQGFITTQLVYAKHKNMELTLPILIKDEDMIRGNYKYKFDQSYSSFNVQCGLRFYIL